MESGLDARKTAILRRRHSRHYVEEQNRRLTKQTARYPLPQQKACEKCGLAHAADPCAIWYQFIHALH
jgi:hypothetical protein